MILTVRVQVGGTLASTIASTSAVNEDYSEQTRNTGLIH